VYSAISETTRKLRTRFCFQPRVFHACQAEHFREDSIGSGACWKQAEEQASQQRDPAVKCQHLAIERKADWSSRSKKADGRTTKSERPKEREKQSHAAAETREQKRFGEELLTPDASG